jgi:hypothetical protein
MSKQLFNNPDGHRGKAEIRIKMYELYDIISDRLEWVKGDFDPDAVCQNICVEIEKHQGTYPNIPGLSEK